MKLITQVNFKLCVLFVLSAFVSNAQLLSEKDKQLHFVAGSLASATGYTYVWNKTKDKKLSLIAGVGTSILAGSIKEILDSTQPGNKFDTRDLTATALGGLTVSVTINLFNNDKSNKKLRKRRLGVYME